uniref:P2X purinoreceptor 7 intracellular domain-containing protein n=2 Tax=Parascaris univalens TaxID=6257 RepID=A0A915AH15_PARUN
MLLRCRVVEGRLRVDEKCSSSFDIEGEMEVGRTLAGRRGSNIPGEPIVVNVDANHTHWFYDTLCSRAERAITSGVNNVLKRTIDGKRLLDARAFCGCGECRIVEDIPVSYAYCCKEVRSGCSSAAKNLTSKIGNLSCITKHPSFASVCLDVEVLNMLATHEGVCTEWLGPEEKFMNRDYRYVAFRAFSYWTHGDDSRGNKFEPPLCVLAQIVQKFPFENRLASQRRGLLNIFGVDFFRDYRGDE